MSDQSVIHKVVYRLDAPVTGLVQTFEVPHAAELVSIGWDTRGQFGIAVWYRLRLAAFLNAGGDDMTTWRLMVRGTGDPFMSEARHLATVVRDGFAWHVFDADGYHIRWAAR